MYLIAAWRTLLVCRLGRSCPELNCEAVFDPSEWKAVWKVTQKDELPTTPPKLETILKLIAQLGGYVNRPGPQGSPGPANDLAGLATHARLGLGLEHLRPRRCQALGCGGRCVVQRGSLPVHG